MPGFTDFLRQRGVNLDPARVDVASRPLAPMAYVVDNSLLRSSDSGVKLRRAPDIRDVAFDAEVVTFGSAVFATPCGGSWVRVGENYLPTEIDGKPVLRRATWLDVDDEDCCRKDTEAKGRSERPLRMGALPVLAKLLLPEETPGPNEGSHYEVLAERVVVRSGPSIGAEALGFAKRGVVVRLFEWDSSRQWRRAWYDRIVTGWGWMLLDHPEFGPLLRPRGMRLCARPLEPMCSAAMEGRISDLQKFVDQGYSVCVHDHEGRSPLQLAVEHGQLDCCVFLMLVGDSTPLRLAGNNLQNFQASALVSAMAGLAHNEQDYLDAVAALSPAWRVVAESLAVATHEAPKMDRASSCAQDQRHAADAEQLRALGATPAGLECEVIGRMSNQGAERVPPEAVAGTMTISNDSADLTPPELVEGSQRLSNEGTELATPDAVASGGPCAYLDALEGELYEVVYASVWVRRDPWPTAVRISKGLQGDRVHVLTIAHNEFGSWGLVEIVTAGSPVAGWMTMESPTLGPLLRPLAG